MCHLVMELTRVQSWCLVVVVLIVRLCLFWLLWYFNLTSASQSVMERSVNQDGLNFEYVQLFSDRRGYELLRALEKEVVYLEGELAKVKVYGRSYNIPRKHVAYGDAGLKYTFSGVTVTAKPWTPLLLSIKKEVEKKTGETFNFVLVNRYKNGMDKIGAHKDDERELAPNASIASVSLGQTRDFVFKRPGRKDYTLPLKNGSLLVMKSPTNRYWTHSLPPRKNAMFVRLNLTFRNMTM